MPTRLSPLDARIGALRKIQEKIAAIRTELTDLPAAYHDDVADELRDVANSLSSEADKPNAVPPRRAAGGKKSTGAVPATDGPSIRERMLVFFLTRGNEAATIADIASGLGVGETGVGTILYRRNNAGEFQKAGKQSGTGAAPATLWNLTDATLEKAREAARHNHEGD